MAAALRNSVAGAAAQSECRWIPEHRRCLKRPKRPAPASAFSCLSTKHAGIQTLTSL
jgi:hypothetical protein